MTKRSLIVCLVGCLAVPAIAQQSKNLLYKIIQLCQVDDRGQILGQQPIDGRVEMAANGGYKVSFTNYQDEGAYQFVKANSPQARDTIVFKSKLGFQFYGYPQPNGLDLWLNRSAQGINQWATAVPSRSGDTGKPPAGPPATNPGQAPGSDLIKAGVFTAIAFYGTTSAPSYNWYDGATGRFSHDQKGIIFRPDGTYYLRAEFGGISQEESGRYAINGDTVRLAFSDGSSLQLKIEQNGGKLHWYSSGMLLAEFFFLGKGR